MQPSLLDIFLYPTQESDYLINPHMFFVHPNDYATLFQGVFEVLGKGFGIALAFFIVWLDQEWYHLINNLHFVRILKPISMIEVEM